MKNVMVSLGQAGAHGVVNGGFRMIQGGRFEHGFMSGFFASLSGSGVGMIKTAPLGLYAIVGAATGGTAEALAGGKFANGAVTGAFVGMFNHGGHGKDPQLEEAKKEYIEKQLSEKISIAAADARDYYIHYDEYFYIQDSEIIESFIIDEIESDTRYQKDYGIVITITDEKGNDVYLTANARVHYASKDKTAMIGYNFAPLGKFSGEGAHFNGGWTTGILNRHNNTIIQISFETKASYSIFNTYYSNGRY